MNVQKAGLVVLGLVLAFWFKGGFTSMPQITRAGTSVRIGKDADENYARYEVGEPADFEAASVGYDFNGGGSVVSSLGGRGVLSWINCEAYAAAAAVSCKTGTCIAGYLNDAEAHGRIGHMLLIPRDKQALAKMRSAKLPMGQRFRIVGEFLDYQAGTLEGHPFNGRLGNISYFLVTSIERR